MVKKFARSLKVFEFKADVDDPFEIMNGIARKEKIEEDEEDG